jgi:hypothetical protein
LEDINVSYDFKNKLNNYNIIDPVSFVKTMWEFKMDFIAQNLVYVEDYLAFDKALPNEKLLVTKKNETPLGVLISEENPLIKYLRNTYPSANAEFEALRGKDKDECAKIEQYLIHAQFNYNEADMKFAGEQINILRDAAINESSDENTRKLAGVKLKLLYNWVENNFGKDVVSEIMKDKTRQPINLKKPDISKESPTPKAPVEAPIKSASTQLPLQMTTTNETAESSNVPAQASAPPSGSNVPHKTGAPNMPAPLNPATLAALKKKEEENKFVAPAVPPPKPPDGRPQSVIFHNLVQSTTNATTPTTAPAASVAATVTTPVKHTPTGDKDSNK